jgi:acyl-CoA thioesterase FadM
MNAWIETYRGAVQRWEIDTVDHFTVAFYFDRFAHASLNGLDALGLGAGVPGRARRRWATVDCYVRYLHELRAGDVLHILSGVIEAGADGLLLGHKLFESASGEVCATAEQRLRPVPGRATAPLTARERRALEARRVAWDGLRREHRETPPGTEGFRDSGRDTVALSEIDATGRSAMSHYVHRFAAANAQFIALFGMTPAYQREQGCGFSTFEFQLAFLGALRSGDSVTVKCGLTHLGASSMRILHRMFNARTGALVATLHQLGVHLDMRARRPRPLPDALRERAKALLVS